MTKRAAQEKVVRKCQHEGAFPVASFIDYGRNEAVLVYDCPECGSTFSLMGSILEQNE